MPIIKMSRLTLVGMLGDRELIIEALTKLGAVQIDEEPEDRSGAQPERQIALADPSGKTSGTGIAYDDMPAILSRLDRVILESGKLKPEKKPLFSGKPAVTASEFHEAGNRAKEILPALDRFDSAAARIVEIDGQIVRLENTQAMLMPWESLDVDLSARRTLKTRSFLGNLKSRTELDALDKSLADEAPESITALLAVTGDSLHIHVVTLQNRESLVLAHLRRLNFTFLPVQEWPATPKELLGRIRSEIDNLVSERSRMTDEMRTIAENRRDFETLHDYLQLELERYQVCRRLSGTGRTFILEGWIPSSLASSIEKALMSKYTAYFFSRPALPGEPFPILLENKRLIKPYEVVVEMFNPPRTGEIDPTPLLAPFYFLFFGMMLSDVGYGLIMSALCAVPLFIFKVKGKSRKSFLLFFQCGLSSMFWGFMFGGYFGDMVSAVTSGRVTIPPVLFDPLKNPSGLMLISVIFGIIHLFCGMGAKAFMLIRGGDWKATLLGVFPWYLVIVGLLLTLAGIGKPYAGYLAIAGAATIVLFSARDSKNPLLRIGKGLYTLYGITSYLGDILSYTRVLALVLATSVIAMVINRIGMIFGPTIFGFIVFSFVFIVGHLVNFALSALSAYIHTSRLHFVEFFGKFYEGGGRFWKPQQINMKYIDMERPVKTASETSDIDPVMI